MLPLERLTQLEAVRLFIARAQAVRPDFTVTNETAPQIAEICVRLDGLPLAIELAAARSKLFPPQALLARLDQRLKLLRDGSRDLPARQQTLANTIAWSYDLLDATQQVIFARLGVFVGGCTLEAAEAVVGDDGVNGAGLAAAIPRGQILDSVSVLVDHSLLRQTEGADGEPRLLMLETVREFALELLAASGEEPALRNRHARYYHDLTEHGQVWLCGPELPGWLCRQRAEQANVRAAIDWSLSAGDAARASRLFGMAAQLFAGCPAPYYIVRIEYQHYTQVADTARAALGAEAFAAVFAAGKALPLEQAVAEALAMPIPGADVGSPR